MLREHRDLEKPFGMTRNPMLEFLFLSGRHMREIGKWHTVQVPTAVWRGFEGAPASVNVSPKIQYVLSRRDHLETFYRCVSLGISYANFLT